MILYTKNIKISETKTNITVYMHYSCSGAFYEQDSFMTIDSRLRKNISMTFSKI